MDDFTWFDGFIEEAYCLVKVFRYSLCQLMLKLDLFVVG